MAQIVPLTVPPKATPGEKNLFKILASLPDDVTVYFDIQIRHRYADFVVISQRLGVLMIEIKDWKPSSIVSADHNRIELRLHTHKKKVTHPLKQAREYALALRDEIDSRLEGRILLEQAGPYKGNICFPISYLAVLSQISRQDIEALRLSNVFDPSRTLTTDWFTAVRDINGQALEEQLAPYFVPNFPFTPLDNVQIDHLRGIIHPHIVVRSMAQQLSANLDQKGRKIVDVIRVLDSKQEHGSRGCGRS
jgi:hypothetical protein